MGSGAAGGPPKLQRSTTAGARASSSTAGAADGGAELQKDVFNISDHFFVTIQAPFVSELLTTGLVPYAGQVGSDMRQDGGLVAEWREDLIPDVTPVVHDTRWLTEQSLLLTVRRAGGQLVGQAELPLAPAARYVTDPIDIEQLTL